MKTKLLNAKSHFSFTQLIIFALIIGSIGGYTIWRSLAVSNQNLPAHPPQAQNQKGMLILTSRQLEFGAADLKHNPVKKPKLQPQLRAIAQERKAGLLNLFKSDPASARSVVLSDDALATLVQNGTDVEQPVTLTGKYGFLQTDSENNGDHIYSQVTTAEGKTYTLDTEQSIPRISIGSSITVSGVLLGDQLLVAQSPGAPANPPPISYTANDPILSTGSNIPAPITVNKGVLGATLGPINDLIMMGNFGGSTDSVNAAYVRGVYNGTPGADVASFVNENSRGKASLAPTYAGVYSFPNISCSDVSSQTTALENAASGQGYIGGNYSLHTYFTNCSGQETASMVGGNPIRYNYLNSGAKTPSGYALEGPVHELSHTLGSWLNHGSYLDCAPQVFVPPTNSAFNDGSCFDAEYQDPYDVLGGGTTSLTGDLSTSHKLDAGWLDSSQVATVTTPGTTSYTLSPYENGTGLVGLKIPRGNAGGYFTVEYRQPLGFDSFLSTQSACPKCNASQGGLIRLAGILFNDGPGGGSDSSIIDTTPGSNADTWGYWPSGDGNDGTLLPGQSFTDPEYNSTINVVSADAAGLTVQVTLGSAACVNAPPSVSSVTPASQVVVPGQSANYSFTVTNNDSSGCNPDKFRFNSAQASFSDFSSSNVGLRAVPDYFTLAPGASTTVTLTANSTANTPDGSYYSSTFQGASGFITSRPYGISRVNLPYFTYQVSSPADSTAPSVPTNAVAKALGSAAASITWSPSTDNTGVISYQVTINGSSILYTSSTSTTILGLLPSTAYNFSIQAFDHKMNLSSPAVATITTPAKTDTVPPVAPSNLSVSATDHSFTLSWLKASDNVGVACYNIGSRAGYGNACVLPPSQASYAQSGLSSQTATSLEVVAFDGDGNAGISEYLNAYTSVQGDPVSPGRPQQLYSAYHTKNGTYLTWQASTDDKPIAGYNVFRGCCKIAYTTSNSYLDPIPGVSTYTVQAVDADGSLSPLSLNFSVNGGSLSADITPPSATVTSPANGSTASGTINIQSSASDNASVDSVLYYLDGKQIGSSTNSSGYPVSLDTIKYTDGPHWLLAEAMDSCSCGAGNTGTSGPINITINNSGNQLPPPPDTTPPTISFSSPTAGSTVSGSVNLAANASDNVAVARVDFLVDGSLLSSDTASPYSFAWDSTTVPNGSHVLMANAYDAANNLASSSVVVTVSNGDTTPPSTPTGLSASAAAYNQVNLAWTASTDNVAVAGYYIVRGGVTIAQTTGTGTTYTDSTVTASTSYAYQVIAYDAKGNSSNLSNTASVTTPNVPDTTAPTAPANLAATAVSSSQINLAWGAATDNIGVSSYDIYRNSQKLASVGSSSTSFGDSGLPASTSYSYYVIARDAASNSSAASNTASATTQSQPPPAATGSIAGTVFSSKGGVVSGATIQITYSGTKHSYSSNSSGVYTITGLPAGIYSSVKYSARGFNGQSLSISVVGGQTTTQNVTLVSRK